MSSVGLCGAMPLGSYFALAVSDGEPSRPGHLLRVMQAAKGVVAAYRPASRVTRCPYSWAWRNALCRCWEGTSIQESISANECSSPSRKGIHHPFHCCVPHVAVGYLWL